MSLDTVEKVTAKLVRRAGEMGCDGLLITGPSDDKTTSTINPGYPVKLHGVRGTCIAY